MGNFYRTRSRPSTAPATARTRRTEETASGADAGRKAPASACGVYPGHSHVRTVERTHSDGEIDILDARVLESAAVARAAPSCSTLTSVVSPSSSRRDLDLDVDMEAPSAEDPANLQARPEH